MTSVSYRKARRVYPGSERPAVDDLDLEIEDGEFLVLVGPSGCGKSTSLRMLAGLEEVDSGSVHIGDRDVTNLAPKERDIAMVFQNYALYPHMTVGDNMAFALKMAKVDKTERDTRVKEAAALLDLTEHLDRKPKSLSGVSANGWRWVVRSYVGPRSSAWTNPCPTSTPSSASRPARRSPRCSSGWASRRSTSPTTRSRR